METHPAHNDSKLQGIHEHHPSNSKHVKYSVQLRVNWKLHNLTKYALYHSNLHATVYSQRSPEKWKSNRLGKPLEPTTKPKRMQIKIRRTFQGCNGVEDNVWNIWING